MNYNELMEMVSSFDSKATELALDADIENQLEEIESLRKNQYADHPILALVVDDNDADLLQLQQQISQHSGDIRLLQSRRMDDAINQLRSKPVDVVLLEYLLPDGMLEPERIANIRSAARNRHLPVVVLTGHGDESRAANAFKYGASDYLSKGDISPDMIYRSIFSAIHKANLERQVARIRNEILESNRDLREQKTQMFSFYQNICNQLKSPLSEAKEFVSLVVEGNAGPVTVEQKSWLNFANQCWDTLEQVTDELLIPIEFTNGKLKPKFSKNNIQEIAQQCLPRYLCLAERKGVGLTYTCSAKSVELSCNSLRIEQLVSKLLQNAIRATPPGANIAFSLETDATGKMLSVVVKDAGTAIPENSLLEAFEQSYPAQSFNSESYSKQCSTRPGLHLCKTIVEQHNGEIVVRSTPAEGNEFRAMLPL